MNSDAALTSGPSANNVAVAAAAPAFISEDELRLVARDMTSRDKEVRRRAVATFANAILTASTAHVRFFAEECGGLDALCAVLTTLESEICDIALESIEAILLVGDGFREANGGINPYAERIEQIGGRESIARLRDHICHTVFQRSVMLMEHYFDEENDCVDDDGGKEVPANDDSDAVDECSGGLARLTLHDGHE